MMRCFTAENFKLNSPCSGRLSILRFYVFKYGKNPYNTIPYFLCSKHAEALELLAETFTTNDFIERDIQLDEEEAMLISLMDEVAATKYALELYRKRSKKV